MQNLERGYNNRIAEFFLNETEREEKASMVRAGFKTKILTLSLAAVAELLKANERTEYGAEFVFGVFRPALEDILSLLTDEDYHQLMVLFRRVKRQAGECLAALWQSFRQYSG